MYVVFQCACPALDEFVVFKKIGDNSADVILITRQNTKNARVRHFSSI
jgi:hypothetical protein